MSKKIKLQNHSKKRKIKVKLFLYIFIFILFLSLTFNYLLSKNININSEVLVTHLLKSNNLKVNSTNKKKPFSVINLINLNYQTLKIKKDLIVKQKNTIKQTPLIYLYNSHQTEEYVNGNIDLTYSINPTVTINDYIMKDVFEKNNLNTIVEERSIKDILNLNTWNYASSYKASRIYLEDIKKTYPSLKFFIDVHRDSLPKDKTTITINDKAYARIIFLIGLENPNYQQNLTFTDKINNKINELYPGLSKGIYKKGGAGVNGVYNQDFSPYTILIEIGGQENTIEEVMNTSLAISNIISEVIKNEG